MKLSIIVSVLNSHEIVRRQYLHYSKMGLPDDVEVIWLDDGSDRPIRYLYGKDAMIDMCEDANFNLSIYETNDKRLWTVAFARNLGAKKAKGEYLLMTDVDYIITKECIEAARNVTEDKMSFKRAFGVLDENGNLCLDAKTLLEYGLQEERLSKRLIPHPNNFVMKKETYWKLGGYDETRMNLGYPKCTSDGHFKGKWIQAYKSGEVTLQNEDLRPTLYMFPSGRFCGDVDYNPFGLFHNLSRKNKDNYWYENMPH
jgi:hypothetical protein